MSMASTHYRLRDALLESGVVVALETFDVLKETPQGYWVSHQYNPSWLSFEELRKRKFLKWVSKTSTKRYCYPTMEEAIRNFKRRKEAQASKLRHQLNQVEAVLDNLSGLSEDPAAYSGGLKLCRPDWMDNLVFY